MFDVEPRRQQLSELEEQMGQSDFWNDRQRAESVSREARALRAVIEPFDALQQRLTDLSELHEMSLEEGDEDSLAELAADVPPVVDQIDQMEFLAMLSDEDDSKDAILEIHPGAGGTEAADWAEMLMRLYHRWIERREFGSEVMDLQPGDEAGIKSVTIEVKGQYAYGYLKAEAGVHRLVRISPFDANKRRHTSFASVFVYPQVDEMPDVELRDEDLQIDVYKAGGAGGQHVNKTSSAVRMTHLPTGITVSCQNERSQLKNKGTALKVLTARVYDYYKQEELKKMEEVESTKMAIDFGSQIRSYVFQPYTLVKDHRTGHESGNVQAVMDGDIDGFIEAFLTAGQAK
ncbi:MAG: peptide chain release factor 2 [Gemmatimonadaceae bacterium]|nr:peptide chain release factor 2 [Gemmatimonadaceae bacterium]